MQVKGSQAVLFIDLLLLLEEYVNLQIDYANCWQGIYETAIYVCTISICMETEILEIGGLYGECVIKMLLLTLSGKGYNLYFDQFFVSQNLTSFLKRGQTCVRLL